MDVIYGFYSDITAFTGQSLWANQILSTYFNWWLRYNYFRFWKTKVRHIGNLLRFRFQPFSRNLHIILHQAIEFRPNHSTHCGNMTSYPFLKMAAATAEYYFRFCICWTDLLPSEGQSLLANQILSRYLKWRLRYFYGNPKWLGVNFFQNQECVNILGCSVTFFEYNVDNVWIQCIQRLHNSGLICNQATALSSYSSDTDEHTLLVLCRRSVKNYIIHFRILAGIGNFFAVLTIRCHD